MKKNYSKYFHVVRGSRNFYSIQTVSKLLLVVVAGTLSLLLLQTAVSAATAVAIDKKVDGALEFLYSNNQAAKILSQNAKGVLVFPDIVKGGVLVGGQFGEGALRQHGKTIGYYNTVSASYGLQLGFQKYGYALFFMTDSTMKYIQNTTGWEIGAGPSVVLVDEGVSKSLNTTSAREDVYAFFFNQQGLMAGLGLQGTKITKINPPKE